MLPAATWPPRWPSRAGSGRCSTTYPTVPGPAGRHEGERIEGVATYPEDGATRARDPGSRGPACFVAKRPRRDMIATGAEGLALAADFTLSEPTPMDPDGTGPELKDPAPGGRTIGWMLGRRRPSPRRWTAASSRRRRRGRAHPSNRPSRRRPPSAPGAAQASPPRPRLRHRPAVPLPPRARPDDDEPLWRGQTRCPPLADR